MQQLLKFFLSLIIIGSLSSCSREEIANSYSGEYSVIDCIAAENNYTDELTPIEKVRFLGKKLIIDTDSITDMLLGTPEVCYQPKIKIETYNTLEYFDGDTLLLNRLRYENKQVKIIKTSCESVFLSEMILMDDGTLLYGVDNYLLLLQKSL